MVRSESVQRVLDNTSVLLLDPHASVPIGKSLEQQAKDDWAYRYALYAKDAVMYLSYLVSMPGPMASMGRHFTDQLVPNLLKLTQQVNTDLGKQITHAFVPLTGVVKVSDLFETINDAQWWFNGGFAKAYAKGRYLDVLAHIFLVPTNLMGIVLFGRDINPSFMGCLGSFAGSIGRMPYVGFVARFAVAPACYVTLCFAYVCMIGDGVQKGVRYYIKIQELSTKNPDDLSYKIQQLKDALMRIAFKDAQSKENKINHLKTKLRNAVWDGITSGAKLVISVVALGVLLKIPVLVAISTCPPAMIALGLVAIVGVGHGIYVKLRQTKPQVDYMRT